MKLLFLDIETAGQYETYEDLPDNAKRIVDKRFDRDPSPGAPVDDYYSNNVALWPELSMITAVSVGYVSKDNKWRTQTYYQDKFDGYTEIRRLEREVLDQVADVLNNNSVLNLCAHNGKRFDYPRIYQRFLYHGITIPAILNITGKKPWEVPLLDTSEMISGTDYRGYMSLDAMCLLLGVDSPKGGITGAECHTAFWEGRIEEIAEYCAKDVLALARCYQVIKQVTPKFIIDEAMFI
jgi:predicted PolB exonuclease-like 3'-5' exonuclease